MSNKIFLPGLNGIRTIAAFGVLFFHTTVGLSELGLNPHIFGTLPDGNPRGTDLGAYGVTMFFALSGFLITYLLLHEKHKTHTINVKAFYIRRVLRIWPLYFIFPIIYFGVLYLFLGYTIVDTSTIPYYIFFLGNIPYILAMPNQLLTRYWSLAVEEQFYLFYPWIAKLKKRSFLITITLLVILLLIVKLLGWYLDVYHNTTLLYSIIQVNRFHVMFLGGIAAILYFNKHIIFLKVCTLKIAQIISWGVIILAACNKFHIFSFIDHELLAIFTLVIIIAQAEKKNRIINLENRVFDFLGKISYGIYVVHGVGLLLLTKVIGKFNSMSFINYLLVFTVEIIFTILVAYLSYSYIEKPFLKIKTKFSKV